MRALKIVKKGILIFVYALFLCLLLEITARVEWSTRRHVPFFSPVSYFYYPTLVPVEKAKIVKGDKRFDILLLGGSVLTKEWGDIPRLLEERLSYATKRRVRVWDLAASAHTTLDSYYKYRHVMDKSFNLVIIYHGINDVRLNNCPPQIYKEDYSQYSWYKVINFFEAHPVLAHLASVYSIYYHFIRIQEDLASPPKYISRKMPYKKWLKYGSRIKTAIAFKRNIRRILEIAKKKGEPVLLMSFCYYVPPNYSYKAFEARKLDYTLFTAPIEIWGTPKNVVKGINAHNAVIKGFAHYPGVTYVDLKASFPQSGQYFNDICHFTQEGCARFVDGIFNAVLKYAQKPPARPGTAGQ